MMEKFTYGILITLMLFFSVFIAGCSDQSAANIIPTVTPAANIIPTVTPAGAGTGTLTGNVSIGPLCPREPCTISHDQLVAAYAFRPITISTPEGNVVTTVIADPETGYVVTLNPGTYIVNIANQGIRKSQELPRTVTIHSGETVRLDISIDTGMR
jgi:ABC-type Fe3+-hydroxamate transport system substrate-binding protein